MKKRRKLLSGILALAMLMSLMTTLPKVISADPGPAVLFTDGDLDQVYFAGDTLKFNLSGLPVGMPPAGIPVNSPLRVSLGIVNASGDFSELQLLDSLTNGTLEGTGWYALRSLNADGTLSADVSGSIAGTSTLPTGIISSKLYAFNGIAWQNIMQGQTPDYLPLSASGQFATAGLDGVLQMPPGVSSDPVLGDGAQDEEDLRDLDISFSKSFAPGITGSIALTGLNLLDSSAYSQLSGLNDGLIMQEIAIPTEGTIAQYTMGVNVAPGALSFLADKGAVVSVSSPSFDGLTTGDFSAVAADVAGGAVSDLTFNDATNTISFTVNHFSSYTLSVMEPASGVAYDGEFDIENATGTGSGWRFDEPTLTITNDGDYRIFGTGTQAPHNVVVNSGVTATVTLDNVNCYDLNLYGTANVTLILKDGTVNTINSHIYNAAVRVTAGAALTIEGGTAGTGQLIANGGNGGGSGFAAAGIGGNHNEGAGTITINGGVITAQGGSDSSGPGAGIGGGGSSRTTLSGGIITINGGTVTAYGGNQRGSGLLHAPGIGGYEPTQLTINGGTIAARGAHYGIYSSTLAIDKNASVQAFSAGAGLAAITGTTPSSGHTAYLLSFALDTPVSGDTDITITQKANPAETFELLLLSGYRNFTTTVASSNVYNGALADGSKKIAAVSDGNTNFPGICEAPGTGLSALSVKLTAEPPYATAVSIAGTAKVGKTLSGQYTFNNADADAESGTSFRWLRGGAESDFYYGFNGGMVYNGPTVSSQFTVTEPTFVSKLWTYHWNNGIGATPGTLSLKDQHDQVYGPWQTTGIANETHWQAVPNITLEPGIYTVIDSGNSTWSYNSISGGAGFIRVFTQAFEPIEGQTAANYTCSGDDGDKMLQFEVTVRDIQGHTGTPVTAITGPVVKVPFWSDGITSTSQYPFGGGDGSSADNAYEISTPEQLAQLAYNVNGGNSYQNKFFALSANIDLTGKQWVPIGKQTGTRFEGAFNGNGHSVSGLTITEASGADAYGLFGNLYINGTIEGVTVASGQIAFSENAGNGYFGGIAGHSLGLIKDCVNKANITITNPDWTNAGGIVGIGDASYGAWTARIFNCHNEGDIQIGRLGSVGGIIGTQFNSSTETYIDQCANSGNITGGYYAEAGGIAGRINNASSIGITNCFNTGNVTSGESGTNQACAGGIVGYEYYSQVKNCYNTGSVTLLYSSLGNTFCGGISGHADIAAENCYNVGTVTGTGRAGEGISGAGIACTNCYYLDTSTPGTAISGTTSLTAAQMKAAASYLNWGFPAVWTINGSDNGGYPALAWQGFPHSNLSSDATLSALTASGITLTPAFDSATTSYIADVSNSISSTTINAATTDTAATVSINGNAGTSKNVALNVGGNIITIAVTAEDGATTKTYTLSVNRAAGGSSGGGGGGGSSVQPTIKVTTEESGSSTKNSTEIACDIAAGSAKGKLTKAIMEALLNKAQVTGGTSKEDRLQVAAKVPDNIRRLEITIPQPELSKIASATDAAFEIDSALLSIVFDGKAIETIAGAASGDSVVISAERLADYNGRPVYDLTVTNGGKTISDFKGGHATVTIPYTLKPGENPNTVVIYYLADDKTLKPMRGHYNAELKAVVFKTTHFSKFSIGYNPVSFTDIPANAWYKNAVDFVAARGITAGTGNNRFAPAAELTRAQFVVLLMNAYQLGTQNQADVNFADAGDTYYTDYLSAAKSLGIVNGVGNNRFAPDQAITRQEMLVMLYNALKVLDELPAATNNVQLTSFNDADKIAAWANAAVSNLVKAGIVTGSNNSLNPTSSTTRAEIAQVVYSLLSK